MDDANNGGVGWVAVGDERWVIRASSCAILVISVALVPVLQLIHTQVKFQLNFREERGDTNTYWERPRALASFFSCATVHFCHSCSARLPDSSKLDARPRCSTGALAGETNERRARNIMSKEWMGRWFAGRRMQPITWNDGGDDRTAFGKRR